MELNEVLNYILYIVLTVILPIVAKYVVNLIKAKIKESTIIDPVEVIITAFKNALSIAAILLSTSSLVINIEEKDDLNIL